VAAATAAWRQLGLEQVLVLPAGQAPLRDGPPRASAADRIAMTRLAFADAAWATVDARETLRPGPSWSIDTARELAREHPRARLIWILGADQLGRLDRWKDVGELLALVEFAVLARDGLTVEAPPTLRGQVRLHRLVAPAVEVSSTLLWEQLRTRRPTNGLPPAVRRQIEERSLYQT
ncbi:MAG: nicotinate-nicotinamide nucleotide adenylyltransferase, partial [Opitutia bacterium]